METLWLDLRFALRQFRRNPAFSLTVILVIALGIGATTAVFSVVDRLLFRSLPYPESDRLVSIGVTIPMMDGEFLMANDYFNLRGIPFPPSRPLPHGPAWRIAISPNRIRGA